jgi:hypothetical protein
MRMYRPFLVIWGAPVALAVAASAQTTPPAAPTPTPAPPRANSPTVRLVPPSPDWAQELSESMPLDPGMVVQTGPATAGEKKATKGEFVIAPIPISDPAVGSGLGVTTVYTVPTKKTEHPSPPPIVGGGAFYTSNASWGVAAVTKLFLKEDRYRVTLGATVGPLTDLFAAGSGSRRDRDSGPQQSSSPQQARPPRSRSPAAGGRRHLGAVPVPRSARLDAHQARRE